MKNTKKQTIHKVLFLAVVLCLIALTVMTAALCHAKPKTAAFVPPPFEASAEVGTPAVPDGLGWQELDAQVFVVSVCGKLVINDSAADVWFTNPDENTVWLKLRVLDADGNTLGETGLIKPGEYVQSVPFETLPKDGETVQFKIMSYEPETYYSMGAAVLNTTAKIGG